MGEAQRPASDAKSVLRYAEDATASLIEKTKQGAILKHHALLPTLPTTNAAAILVDRFGYAACKMNLPAIRAHAEADTAIHGTLLFRLITDARYMPVRQGSRGEHYEQMRQMYDDTKQDRDSVGEWAAMLELLKWKDKDHRARTAGKN